MSKKALLGGVLLGAGAVVGVLAASKNDKVKGKIEEIKENEKVKETIAKVEAIKENEKVLKVVEKSKDVVNKGKEASEKGINKIKESRKNSNTLENEDKHFI